MPNDPPWLTGDTDAQGHCSSCGEQGTMYDGCPNDCEDYEMLPYDENETLEPGDWCDDCETNVASDGECECNQEEDDE